MLMKLIRPSVIVELLLTIPTTVLPGLQSQSKVCNQINGESEMQAINDLETIVLSAFATTPTECQQWINSNGIY